MDSFTCTNKPSEEASALTSHGGTLHHPDTYGAQKRHMET